VINSIAYFCKVLSDEELIYRVVKPDPTKVNLNQLVIGKVLRKEGNKYFQIGPHSMRLPLPLSIKLDPQNLDTQADPAMYLTVANLAPPMSPQLQTPQSTRHTPQTSQQGEVTNQMLYEQMNSNFTAFTTQDTQHMHNMYGWMSDIDRRVHDVWHLTEHINNWHINRGDYHQHTFPPPYPADQRWFTQAPPSTT
jgi:hypothetical protein